jgi:hypothetical protein
MVARSIERIRGDVRDFDGRCFSNIRELQDCDQVELEARQVGDVIARQAFAKDVGVNEAHAAKASASGAMAPEIGQFEALGVADDDVLHTPAPVDDEPDLAVEVVGNRGELLCEVARDDFLDRNGAAVETFEDIALKGFEASRMAVDRGGDGGDPCAAGLVERRLASCRARTDSL